LGGLGPNENNSLILSFVIVILPATGVDLALFCYDDPLVAQLTGVNPISFILNVV